MSEPTFKVGDRVRIIKGTESRLWPNVLITNRVGAVGTIIDLSKFGDMWAYVYRDDGIEGPHDCHIWFSNLELIDDASSVRHPSGGAWNGKVFTSKDGFTYTKEHLDKLITELMEIRVWIEDQQK